jgi:hypothetical protein
MLGVTEVGEGHRFSWAVAEFSGDAERALVALGGLGKVAKLVLAPGRKTLAYHALACPPTAPPVSASPSCQRIHLVTFHITIR